MNPPKSFTEKEQPAVWQSKDGQWNRAAGWYVEGQEKTIQQLGREKRSWQAAACGMAILSAILLFSVLELRGCLGPPDPGAPFIEPE